MKAYSNLQSERLFIEDSDTLYEFIEHDSNVLEICDDWTDGDCKDYLKRNEAVKTKNL